MNSGPDKAEETPASHPLPESYFDELEDSKAKEFCQKIRFFREAGEETELSAAFLELGRHCGETEV